MHNALGDTDCYFINYTFWREIFLCLLNRSCKNRKYHYIKENIHITQKIWHKPSNARQPIDDIRILCLPLTVMQISKKFEQNVIIYAITLWQEDLQAHKVSMPSWSFLTTVTLSFFKCPDLLPHKAGFHTPQRHNYALRNLEIHFLPEDALMMFCLREPSSPPWCYQAPLSLLLLLMGSVLYFLHCQSALLARVWGQHWV